MFKNFMKRPTAEETHVAATAQARVAGSAQIVDVREKGEWAAGRIPGAIHMPLGQLSRRLGELNPQQPVITVCRSGNRSLLAAEMLTAKGFADVKSLAGGMESWARAGEPIEQ